MSQQKTNVNQIIGITLLIVLVWFGGRKLWGKFFADDTTVKTESASTEMVNVAAKVGPVQFQELIKNEEVFILDVHTPQQTHIPGTDSFIPFDQISQNLDKLPPDKSTPIAVYCRSGGMSAGVSQELIDLGYKTVYDLSGGIKAFKQKVDPEIAITPSVQDLGTVIYGEIATTQFSLTNFSDQPLNITRVSTSCGCTSAKADTTELGPYESTTINVAFDPAVHKDDTDLGELTRTIYIATDRAGFEKFETSITAHVIRK